MSKPSIDWKLLGKTFRAHLWIVTGMVAMTTAFTCFGALLVLQTSDAAPFTGDFFGSLFLISAIGLVVLNVRLNGSSIAFYYQQGMLKKYGQEINARVIGKTIEDSKDRRGIDLRLSRSITIERELVVSFSYEIQGSTYESESRLADRRLFDAIGIAQEIPILVLSYQPDVAHIKVRKLKSMLKTPMEPLPASGSDATTGQDLIDHDF